MTGYGRSDFAIGPDTYALEIKSLNHRFIDISVRTSDRFYPFETKIREEVKKRFARGSFSLFVSTVSVEAPALRLNIQAAQAYLEAAKEVKEKLGVGGDVELDSLLKVKDIFISERKLPGEDDWEPVKKALDTAFSALEDWRTREGDALKVELFSRLATLEVFLGNVDARVPKVLEAYRHRLTENMKKLLEEKVDESRILFEAAVFAERSDVSEEVARLKSHLEMFRKNLKFEEPVGKKLDFLCQEIGREINTIGSKSNDVEITQTVIEMKGELEKIREQVQNIE